MFLCWPLMVIHAITPLHPGTRGPRYHIYSSWLFLTHLFALLIGLIAATSDGPMMYTLLNVSIKHDYSTLGGIIISRNGLLYVQKVGPVTTLKILAYKWWCLPIYFPLSYFICYVECRGYESDINEISLMWLSDDGMCQDLNRSHLVLILENI